MNTTTTGRNLHVIPGAGGRYFQVVGGGVSSRGVGNLVIPRLPNPPKYFSRLPKVPRYVPLRTRSGELGQST